MMMAHSFVEHGVLSTRAVPIQNYDPLGAQPDAYVRWPPLFPLVLASNFRLFGESEAVARWTMLALTFLSSLGVGILAAICFDVPAGLLAAFAYLVTPVVFRYGRVVVHTQLAVLFIIITAVLITKASQARQPSRKYWVAAVIAAMVLATASSWEPLLAPLGILGFAVLTADRKTLRLGTACLAAAVIAFLAIQFLYLSKYPFLFEGLKASILFRAQLTQPRFSTQVPLHVLTDVNVFTSPRPSRLETIGALLGRFALQSPFVLLGLVSWVVLSARRRPCTGLRPMMVLSFLIAPWILWFMLMSQHAAGHAFASLTLVPAATFAFGGGISTAVSFVREKVQVSDSRRLDLVAYGLLPFLMILPLAQYTRHERIAPELVHSTEVPFARAIQAHTPPGAVIFVPSDSPVSVYYSQRHLIRGIADNERLAVATTLAARDFPGAKIYFAIPPEYQDYNWALDNFDLVTRTPEAAVYVEQNLRQERSSD